MRILLPALVLGFLVLTILSLQACGGGANGGSGSLIADFDLQDEEYLADPETPLERLCSIFTPRRAHALANLGFDSNSYPYNRFFGERPAQEGLHVVIMGSTSNVVAEADTDDTGRAVFDSLPLGYLTLMITGSDGNAYHVPVQVSEDRTSRTRVLVYRDPLEGVVLTAKTIHDDDGDGENDDSFSYAVFGRPRNAAEGGRVHLHTVNRTRVDIGGDGSYGSPGDYSVKEPDDDGVSTDDGDGDEDNDGILDYEDEDIDGDGTPNDFDDDRDGDGIANAADAYPDGLSPNDDYDAPTLDGGEPYGGVMDLANPAPNTITVFFPVGVDANEPVRYIIYYSTTTPIDFEMAETQTFQPVGQVSPDEILSDNVTGLLEDQTYYFAVRAQDSAQPPNVDENTNEKEVYLGPW